jgi:hypothetical protein
MIRLGDDKMDDKTDLAYDKVHIWCGNPVEVVKRPARLKLGICGTVMYVCHRVIFNYYGTAYCSS